MKTTGEVKMMVKGVVHVRRAPYDVYIGRKCAEFPGTKWGNPYRVGVDGEGSLVMRLYRAWVIGNSFLMGSLPELDGKVLGCWCKKRGDEPCHGDVLAELVKELE